MQVIIGIVVFLFVLGIIANILGWMKNNIGIVVLVVGSIFAIGAWGFWAFVKIAIVLFILLLIGSAIYNHIATRNEEQLNQFLNTSCREFGYMNSETWAMKLPDFAKKIYNTSFEEITRNFGAAMEKQYITDDMSLSWIDPATNYLAKAFAADVWELERVPSPGLRYTHNTPNGKLIQEAMEQLSIHKKINEKKLIQQTSLEVEAVCKNHNFRSVEEVPPYYLYLYKITDYFMQRSSNTGESNFETEEFSLDDL